MSLKLVLFGCFITLATGKRLPRLAGGFDAEPGQFPYQVNLYYTWSINNELPIAFGGGAILNEQWILTAAYNIFLVSSLDQITIKAGNVHLKKPSESEQISNVTASFVHPNYNDAIGPNDIGLLKLETPLKFNKYVQPIDLPQANSYPHGFGVLTGLGSVTHISGAMMAQVLQTLTLPIIGNTKCRNLVKAVLGSFANEIDFFGDDLAFCTGPTETNQSYCLHDTGNPLVIVENGKKVVVGVATFGFAMDCTTPGVPSIYTRVSSFNDWIQETISKN